MEVMSLDTNIQQNEGILKLNFFHFNGKHYPENYGTAMGTKTAVLIPLPIFS